MNQDLLVLKRKNLGYSQQQMATLLGYKDKSSYCLIEKGKVSITLNISKKIKQALQLTDNEYKSIFL